MRNNLLLFLCVISFHGSALIASDYIAVFYDGVPSNANMIETHSSGQAKTLSQNMDVASCGVSISGQYVFCQSNHWFAGSVMNTNPPSLIDSNTVPKGAYRGMPSNSGKLICWLGKENEADSITVWSYEKQPKKLFFASNSGIFGTPTWSPDDTKIAYYYKDTSSIQHGDYSLRLLNLYGGKPQIKEIAPPSEPSYQSPGRKYAPDWSPSGQFICFYGQYTNYPHAYRFLVPINGHGVSAVTNESSYSHLLLFTLKEPNAASNAIIDIKSVVGSYSVPVTNNIIIGNNIWGDTAAVYLVAPNHQGRNRLGLMDKTTMETFEMPGVFYMLNHNILWCGKK